MRKAELLQMLRRGVERETYRKDKVPTLKGSEPSRGHRQGADDTAKLGGYWRGMKGLRGKPSQRRGALSWSLEVCSLRQTQGIWGERGFTFQAVGTESQR